MIIRRFKQTDIPQLVELVNKHSFEFPKFANLLDVLVVEKDDKILAWGYTEKMVEVVFVPDVDASKKDKVESLKLLVETSNGLTKERGIEQIHSFVVDERFASILKKHFGYRESTGQALYFNV